MFVMKVPIHRFRFPQFSRAKKINLSQNPETNKERLLKGKCPLEIAALMQMNFHYCKPS